MRHYLEMRPEYQSPSKLAGPWPGLKVQLVDGHLFIQPTESPIVKPGTPFMKLPANTLVFGKVKGGRPGEHRNLGELAKRGWWISTHTVDPHHIITDWDGVSYLDTAGQILTPTNDQLLDVLRSKVN